jgi:hypothetical protein
MRKMDAEELEEAKERHNGDILKDYQRKIEGKYDETK